MKADEIIDTKIDKKNEEIIRSLPRGIPVPQEFMQKVTLFQGCFSGQSNFYIDFSTINHLGEIEWIGRHDFHGGSNIHAMVSFAARGLSIVRIQPHSSIVIKSFKFINL